MAEWSAAWSVLKPAASPRTGGAEQRRGEDGRAHAAHFDELRSMYVRRDTHLVDTQSLVVCGARDQQQHETARAALEELLRWCEEDAAAAGDAAAAKARETAERVRAAWTMLEELCVTGSDVEGERGRTFYPSIVVELQFTARAAVTESCLAGAHVSVFGERWMQAKGAVLARPRLWDLLSRADGVVWPARATIQRQNASGRVCARLERFLSACKTLKVDERDVAELFQAAAATMVSGGASEVTGWTDLDAQGAAADALGVPPMEFAALLELVESIEREVPSIASPQRSPSPPLARCVTGMPDFMPLRRATTGFGMDLVTTGTIPRYALTGMMMTGIPSSLSPQSHPDVRR